MGLFRVKTNKVFEGYPFVNEYVINHADLTTGDVPATAIMDFERHLVGPDVQIKDAIVSNLQDPSRLGFITVPYDHPGTAGINADSVVNASIVLWLSLNTGLGRPGKKFYRFAINKTDVVAKGGVLTLSNLATFQGVIAPWATTLLTALTAGGGFLLAGKFNTKVVQSISLVGCTNNKPSHKYFDTKKPG